MLVWCEEGTMMQERIAPEGCKWPGLHSQAIDRGLRQKMLAMAASTTAAPQVQPRDGKAELDEAREAYNKTAEARQIAEERHEAALTRYVKAIDEMGMEAERHLRDRQLADPVPMATACPPLGQPLESEEEARGLWKMRMEAIVAAREALSRDMEFVPDARMDYDLADDEVKRLELKGMEKGWKIQ